MKRIIIGFDPGLADTGFGVIEDHGSKIVYLECGSIKTPAKTPLPERLKTVHEAASELIARYKPELVAIEQLFFSRNVSTALTVGQARGVVMLSAAQHNLKVVEFTPNQVKQAVSAYGSAGKAQVQRMVQTILGLKEIPKPDDAADALAVAICACGTRVE